MGSSATQATDARPRVTFREVFGVAEFRAMWFAELLSIVGDQLARVALSVLVFRDTGSATLTGLTYALTYAPSLIGGILLSGLADRYPRRDVMAIVDTARCLLILLVAIPGLPFWVMCVLVGSVALLHPVFKSGQLALLPDVLTGDRYLVGMAIRSMTIQSSQMVGFAGGGLLIIVMEPHLALVLDSVTFAASALLIRFGVRARPAAARPADAPARSWLGNVGAGGKLTFSDPGIRALVVLSWLMASITAYEGLAAPYAAAIGGGSATIGLILASDPLGGVLGAYLFSRWVPVHVRPRLIAPLAVLAAATLVGCLLRPGLPVTMVLLVVSGGLGTVVVLQGITSFTLATPDASRSQVLGLSNSGLSTASGLSPLLAGILADHIGAAPAIGWFGLGGVLLVIPFALSWWRSFHANPSRWIPDDAAPK